MEEKKSEVNEGLHQTIIKNNIQRNETFDKNFAFEK